MKDLVKALRNIGLDVVIIYLDNYDFNTFLHANAKGVKITHKDENEVRIHDRILITVKRIK